jgi:hypothetical protein
MKTLFKVLISLTICMLAFNKVNAQTVCDPSKIVGNNLVVNGGFESGNTGFTTSIGCSWNILPANCPTRCHGDWSMPNQYYVGGSPSETGPCGKTFQSGFFGSPHSGTKFLMVDGDGANNPIVWQQSVTVEANTWYYFEVYISTIGTNPVVRANLDFDINGVVQATDILAPNVVNQWVAYTQTWYSGAVSGSISIKIRDSQVFSSGNDKDDFGLDDIVFRKGCPPSAYTIQPELGPDKTLCGSPGYVTLNPNVTLASNNHIWWSTGVNDGDLTIDVSVPQKYYVCVDQDSKCTKIDSIYVSDTYSLDLGSDVDLCDPTSVTLDAGHSGTGVTYQWYKGNSAIPAPLGTGRTYTVNNSGKYKVEVNDVMCDKKSDSTNITIKSRQPDPQNVEYCRTVNHDTLITFRVTPAGTNYDWYDALSGGNLLASNTDNISRTIVYGDTLYARDNTTTDYPALGPSSLTALDYSYTDYSRKFDVYEDLTLKSVVVRTVEYQGGPCNGKGPGTASASFTISLYKDNVATGQAVTTTVLCGQSTDRTVTLNFNCTAGTNYELKVNTSSGGAFCLNTSEKGEYSQAGIIKIQSHATNSGPYGKWIVNAKSACKRVPVMAWDICTLPLDITSFKASRLESGILLNWEIAVSKHETVFEIQRHNGQRFETIGTVDARNFREVSYSFTDESAPSGTLYYRIKQVTDGKPSYSHVLSVENDNIGVSVSPNPFGDHVTMTTENSGNNTYHIFITDSRGQELYNFTTGEGVSDDLLKDHVPGIYFMKIISGTESKTIRLIKQ